MINDVGKRLELFNRPNGRKRLCKPNANKLA